MGQCGHEAPRNDLLRSSCSRPGTCVQQLVSDVSNYLRRQSSTGFHFRDLILLDDRDSMVRFPVGAGNFSLHHRIQNDAGAYPTSYPMGTRGSFPGVKRPGREAYHSPPSNAEVKE
jgi:hypothetical protein